MVIAKNKVIRDVAFMYISAKGWTKWVNLNKCDGLRPTCTQCLRSARPGDACEYADSGRTRTQMLEDNISRLEARIRELEEPDDENAGGMSSLFLDTQRNSNSPSIASSSGHGSTYSTFQERIIHAIQAETLLSVYFFRTGRILEGKYHMSAAVSLTLGTQLHKIRALPVGSGNPSVSPLQQISVAGPLLSPPIDQIEEGERINAFWIVYTLSNCWGVAVGTLSSAVFESHGSTIDTPWPLDMTDYEQVMLNASRASWTYGADFESLLTSQELLPAEHYSVMTVQNFLRQVPSSSVKEFSTMAMFAKASILLDKSANIASLYRSDMNADEASRFGATFSSLNNLIDNFQSSLGFLPLNQHASSSYEFGTILTTHTLAYTATIQLHSVFINNNSHSRRKALSAARACVAILRQVDMSVMLHINAVLGSCWTTVCQVFIDEIKRLRRTSTATAGVGIAGGSRLHSRSSRTENWGISEGGLDSISDGEEAQLKGMLEKVFTTMAVFSIESPLIGGQNSCIY
ncbi:hypothetical protein HHX47_DHR1000886 [Lentinula edodes]|nr:hypothetical protein HHX47_DHR1000886 [Lentinula edodes]